jgi:hypothetical protein
MLFCGDLFASPCLVLKLVYNGNCLLVDQWPVTCRLTSWALQSGLSHGDEILHNYIICQVLTPPKSRTTCDVGEIWNLPNVDNLVSLWVVHSECYLIISEVRTCHWTPLELGFDCSVSTRLHRVWSVRL